MIPINGGDNNYFLNWEFGQLVTPEQMDILTNDIYNKIGALTENTLPCIITGGNVTISGGNLVFTGGFFRTQDITEAYLPQTNIQGFMYVAPPVTPIAAIANYYVVATIAISPMVDNETTYLFEGAYSIIPDLTPTNYNPDTMVILGQIDVSATFVIFTQRDYDYGNLLSILAHQKQNIQNSDYQILPTDNTITYTSSSVITYTLPDVTLLGKSNQFTIQNLGNSHIILSGGSTNIQNNTTITVTSYAIIVVQYSYTANQWLIISSNPIVNSHFLNYDFGGSGVYNLLSNIWSPNEWNMISSNVDPSSGLGGTYGRIATFLAIDSLPDSSAFLATGYNGVATNRLELFAGDGTANSAYRLAYSQGAGYAPPTQNAHVLVLQDFPSVAQQAPYYGYVKLPNGIIIQWASAVGISTSGQHFSYPIVFPNMVLSTVVTPYTALTTGTIYAVSSFTTNEFTVVFNDPSPSQIGYIAIGY